MKNVFRNFYIVSIFLSCIGTISCGVSTGEIILANDNGNNKADTGYEEAPEVKYEYEDVYMGLINEKIKVISVMPDEIPIIEICPPPYDVYAPGENVIEKEPGRPGDSYDNLLSPVDETDSEMGKICVLTNVPGVKVSFNSKVVGESNLGVIGITPRIYILGLSKEGYKEENLWISVGENKQQTFFIKMEKLED